MLVCSLCPDQRDDVGNTISSPHSTAHFSSRREEQRANNDRCLSPTTPPTSRTCFQSRAARIEPDHNNRLSGQTQVGAGWLVACTFVNMSRAGSFVYHIVSIPHVQQVSHPHSPSSDVATLRFGIYHITLAPLNSSLLFRPLGALSDQSISGGPPSRPFFFSVSPA